MNHDRQDRGQVQARGNIDNSIPAVAAVGGDCERRSWKDAESENWRSVNRTYCIPIWLPTYDNGQRYFRAASVCNRWLFIPLGNHPIGWTWGFAPVKPHPSLPCCHERKSLPSITCRDRRIGIRRSLGNGQENASVSDEALKGGIHHGQHQEA
jgi:hypothetical protein